MDTIDAYLANVPPADAAALDKLRRQILALAPDATESISYGVPTLSLHGHLVGFAAFAKHLSFFPMSTTILAELAADVAPYLFGKSTLRFTAKEPLPAGLIKKVVKARIAENLAVLAARAAKKRTPRVQRTAPTKSTPADASTRKTKR